MLTRRAALFRAAGLAAAPLLATAAKAEEAMTITDAIETDLSNLPRRKQALVAPQAGAGRAALRARARTGRLDRSGHH